MIEKTYKDGRVTELHISEEGRLIKCVNRKANDQERNEWLVAEAMIWKVGKDEY